MNLFTAAEGRKNYFWEKNEILDGFLKEVDWTKDKGQRTKVGQVYRCRRPKNFFGEKRNFGWSKFVSKALSSFTALGLKLS